jgi:prepilin-type processing-associated H-X9-DG protein
MSITIAVIINAVCNVSLFDGHVIECISLKDSLMYSQQNTPNDVLKKINKLIKKDVISINNLVIIRY